MIVATVLALVLGVASLPTRAAVTQLGFAIDGSGSIGPADFTLQTGGLAAAFAALPTDSTVEVTIVQFASGSVLEQAPLLIDSPATRQALIDTTNAITQTGGGTNIPAGVSQLTTEMTGSANFDPTATDQSFINVSTDGVSSGDLNQAGTDAVNAGIDSISAEAVGGGANPGLLVPLVRPLPLAVVGGILPADSAPPNPLNGGWVLPITNFNSFAPAIAAKIQVIVPTPEPASLAVFAIGLLGLGFIGYRRKDILS
jgi:hypothetical protein